MSDGVKRTPSLKYVPSQEEGMNTFWATANFLNALFGAGIVLMPSAIKSTGLISVPIMLLITLASWYCSRVLVKAGIRGGYQSYEELVEKTIGTKWSYGVMIAATALNYGVLITYITMIADMLELTDCYLPTDLGETALKWSYHGLCGGLVTVLLLPLCLLRDVSSLGVTSVFGVFSSFVLAGVIVWKSMWYRDHVIENHGLGDEYDQFTGSCSFIGHELGTQIGTLMLFYVNQDMVFAIFTGLKENTLEQWNKVANITYSTLWIAQSAIGVLVLAIAGAKCIPESTCILSTEKTASAPIIPFDGVHGSELFDRQEKDETIDVLKMGSRYLLLLVLVFMFVLNHYSCREFLNSVLCKYFGWEVESAKRSNILTICLLYSAFVLAIVIPDVSIVTAFTGLLAGVPLGFVIPSLVGLSEASVDSKEEDADKEDEATVEQMSKRSASRTKDKAILWTIMVFGIFFAVVGVLLNIQQMVAGPANKSPLEAATA